MALTAAARQYRVPPAAVPSRARPPLLGQRGRLLALLALLPLFAGTFHYSNDVPPLFVLSKVWPLLMLPAALLAFAQLHLPGRSLYSLTLGYLLTVPPLMAMFYLNSGLTDALTITVKIFPLTFFFSLSWMLVVLRVSAAELRRSLLLLGLVTFGLLGLLWVLVPQSMYRSEFGIDTIFIGNDDQRGDRIQLPLFFGLLFLFHLGRKFARDLRFIHLVQIVICYGLMITIYKERIPILFSFGIIVLNVVSTLMRSRVLAVMLLGCLTLGLGAIGLMVEGADLVTAKLGGSLSVRLDTIGFAWDYIRDDPIRWLFGVGATTKYSAVTLNEMFRDPAFFLADIGWLGVVFESGLAGALTLAGLYVIGIRIAGRFSDPADTLSLAIVDHTVYLAAASLIYSPTLLPGEIATLTALGIYLGRMRL